MTKLNCTDVSLKKFNFRQLWPVIRSASERSIFFIISVPEAEAEAEAECLKGERDTYGQ